ncbi:MAG: hypothetical protein PHD97_11915, partial [Bacteroidales bacterium]|nr:hypothetical protein [Bacteroidales bacterium]
MKKILLISIAAGIYACSFGQTATTNFNKSLATQACRQMAPASDLNVPAGPVLPENKTVRNERYGTEIVIGKTKYDYQSNRGMARRFHVFANGKKNAAWMISVAGSPYADRGTACNFYTPVVGWSPFPQEVTPLTSMMRIENVKTGYGSWAPTNNDAGEAVIAHDANSKLNMATRATIGTGTWTTTSLSSLGVMWPRVASGGPNNNTL